MTSDRKVAEAAQRPVGAVGIDAYYLPASKPYVDEIKICRTRQIEGPDKWSVRRSGECLNKRGEWEWEPMPSSRDDDFMARCRFDSPGEAIEAALAETQRSSHNAEDK